MHARAPSAKAARVVIRAGVMASASPGFRIDASRGRNAAADEVADDEFAGRFRGGGRPLDRDAQSLSVYQGGRDGLAVLHRKLDALELARAARVKDLAFLA